MSAANSEIAWMSRPTEEHTCQFMYSYIQEEREVTSMVLAAIWRIIHCNHCGFIYHKNIAESSKFAHHYIVFGGNVKILYSKKPKRFIRDLPSIKNVLAKGVKSDPLFKPGAVKSVADNAYIFKQLGDVAVLAGMIDPEYVTEDIQAPLNVCLIKYRALDSIPFSIDDVISINDNISGFIGMRHHLRRLWKNPDMIDDHPHLIATLTLAKHIDYIDYLMCEDVHILAIKDVKYMSSIYEKFSQTELYAEHIAKCTDDYLKELQNLYPDKEIIFDENPIYLVHDLNIVVLSDKVRVMSERSARMRSTIVKDSIESKLNRIRLLRDHHDIESLTALEIREILIERYRKHYFLNMDLWRHTNFNNCRFDAPDIGTHPTVCVNHMFSMLKS